MSDWGTKSEGVKKSLFGKASFSKEEVENSNKGWFEPKKSYDSCESDDYDSWGWSSPKKVPQKGGYFRLHLQRFEILNLR